MPETTYSDEFVIFHSFLVTLSPTTLIPGIIQLAISQQQPCYSNHITIYNRTQHTTLSTQHYLQRYFIHFYFCQSSAGFHTMQHRSRRSV